MDKLPKIDLFRQLLFPYSFISFRKPDIFVAEFLQMKKHVILSAFFLILAKHNMFCQETEQLKFNIGISSGYAGNTTSDRLLNYYIYSGHTFLPLNVTGSYLRQKNLIIVKFFYYNLKSLPNNLNHAFYEYNYIKNWTTALDIAYYRKVLSIQNNIRIFAGIENSAYTIIHQEFYKNLLYDYAMGYRKSYDLTPVNLSPELLVSGSVKKNSIRLQAGFSLVTLASRPSDDYTKQLGLNTKFTWKTYFPGNYKGWNLSVLYQYNIFKSFDLTAEFNVLYHSYAMDEYKYLQKLVFIGIIKEF